MNNTARRTQKRKSAVVKVREMKLRHARAKDKKFGHLLSREELEEMDAKNNFTMPTPALYEDILKKVVDILGINVLADKTCIVCDLLHENSDIKQVHLTYAMKKVNKQISISPFFFFPC